MRDHWWWRPGWRLGRRAYTFHITFEDPDAVEGSDDLRRMATEYHSILATLPGLDLVPVRWLHLTMQNVGFTDEVPEMSADAVLAAGRRLCSQLEPFDLTFEQIDVRQEAIALRPTPAEPVAALRDRLRVAIASVVGTTPEAPEHAHGFDPHVSIAYSNRNSPLEPYLDAVANVQAYAVSVRVLAAKLIVLDRDERVYRWSTYGVVPLGHATV
jgi:2'-5' RNA ligase